MFEFGFDCVVFHVSAIIQIMQIMEYFQHTSTYGFVVTFDCILACCNSALWSTNLLATELG